MEIDGNPAKTYGSQGQTRTAALSLKLAQREIFFQETGEWPVLLLDELTANLDEDAIWDVFHLLDEMNRRGTTIVMATHAKMFVNMMRKRVITLVDGKVFGDVAKGRYGDII